MVDALPEPEDLLADAVDALVDALVARELVSELAVSSARFR